MRASKCRSIRTTNGCCWECEHRDQDGTGRGADLRRKNTVTASFHTTNRRGTICPSIESQNADKEAKKAKKNEYIVVP